MPLPRLQFELPKNVRAIDYVDELIAKKKFARDCDLAFSRFFLDTFDWRLFGKGFMMVSDSTEGQFRTTWQTIDNAEILGVFSGQRLPVFASDFPGEKMRRILGPIVEMRALIPQSEMACLQQRLRLLNKNDKTVLRLNIESYTVEDANRERKKLGPRVLLEAVRGYDKPFNEIAALLNECADFRAAENNLLIAALNKVGRYPQDYCSKFDLALEPSMRADSALRIIFRRLFSNLEVNEHGTKQDIDCEFLHDFRVAIRRTRALIGQSKAILAEQSVDHFAREFSWLGKATGPTRDLDVYLLNFEGYKKSVPISIRSDLDPLCEYLRAKQRMAHTELVVELESERYRNLKEEWKKFLAKPGPEKATEPLACRRIKWIADFRIWQAYKIIRSRGRKIGPDTRPAKLHRLRIHCKKLRYLIEFFGSLYPDKSVRHLVDALKGLQDNLGDFQDLEVQEKTLQRFSGEMMETGTAARTLLAMGVLVQELEKQREAVRFEFMQRFAAFDSTQNQKLFYALFKNEQDNLAK